MAAGADVYADCRATLVETDRGRARAVVTEVLDRASDRPRSRFVAYARRGVVLCGGAINTPALLLRSKAGTGSGQVGRRTFLHPTVPLISFYDQPIEAFYGPPQSVAVHHFADRGDRVGYFFETAPIHPMLAALAFPGFGDTHRKIVERLPYAQATIALLIDGHHDDDGGTVATDGDGRIKLNYPLSAPLREAAVAALADMARLQLAAGAREVMTLHETPLSIRSEADLARHRGRAVRPQPPHDVLGAPDGGRSDGRGPRPLGRRLARPPPPAREPLDRRRLGLPDQPRRQPPALGLRPRPPVRDRDREERLTTRSRERRRALLAEAHRGRSQEPSQGSCSVKTPARRRR